MPECILNAVRLKKIFFLPEFSKSLFDDKQIKQKVVAYSSKHCI